VAAILICGNDDLVRCMLERVLRQDGHLLHAFRSGEAALAWLGSNRGRAQVLLIDDNLLDTDGRALLRRASLLDPDAVGILLSGVAGFLEACWAINQGSVFRLLAKPFQLEELRVAIAAAEEGHRQRRRRRRAAQDQSLPRESTHLRKLAAKLEGAVEERTLTLLDGLLAALDLRDPGTQWHSRRISIYAGRLGEAMGLTGAELADVEWGTLLHDLGKIGVRDAILHKPGPLDENEWVEIRRHPVIGKQILGAIPFLAGAAEVVHAHHERWNGGGYPRNLQGEQICIGARVFAVVDCYDAITSDKPYRKGGGYEAARGEILRCSGTQFDPQVVVAFCAVAPVEWLDIAASVERTDPGSPRGQPHQPVDGA